jgi:hypothetical protein
MDRRGRGNLHAMQVVAILVSGIFRIHQCGCRDIPADCQKSGAGLYPFDVTSYVDVALKCYAAFIPDEMELGDALKALTFHHCTQGLRFELAAARLVVCAPGPYHFAGENFRSRRLFHTTNTDDSVIVAAAISGFRKPSAANGNASRL